MAIPTTLPISFSSVCQELYGNSNTNGKSLISGAHGSAVQANFVPGYDTFGASKTLLDFRGYTNTVSAEWVSRASAADNSWTSVAYGNSLFVALSPDGTNNRIMTSPDGITWTSRTTDNEYRLSITYGNGLFVALGSSSNLTSSDGITWTTRTTINTNRWTSVAYGNSLFVAVSDTGIGNRVMTSPDGITWTSRSSAADNSWTSVAYGNSIFIAVALTGTGNRIMTSPDGITWTSRNASGDMDWIAVAFGNGKFVAIANNGSGQRGMTSTDGITWTGTDVSYYTTYYGLAYGNELFVGVGAGSGNKNIISSDGINWTTKTNAANNSWRAVVYGNGKFVAVSSDGVGNRVMTYDHIAPNTTIPTVPTGLAAQSITATGFTLTWNASTDDVGIAGYKVYKNGALHVTTSGTPTTYIVSGQTASTNSTWTVAAYDAAGNNSAQSSGLSVTQSTESSGNFVPTLSPLQMDIGFGEAWIYGYYSTCYHASGIEGYQYQYSKDMGQWVFSSLLTSGEINFTHYITQSGTYRYQVRAKANSGAYSAWSNLEEIYFNTQMSQQ